MRRLIALVVALVLVWGAYPAAAQDGGEGDAPADNPTIAQILHDSAENEASPEFTMLYHAVEEAGLMPVLEDNGPFTVFAPTDAAFEATLVELGITFDDLAHDYELLLSVLLYHIVPGAVDQAALETLGEARLATAFPGTSVAVVAGGDGVSVNEVRVVGTDVLAANGVIHIIEGVLLPEAGTGSLETLARAVPEASLYEELVAASEGNSPEARQYEILLQLITATDLMALLEDEGPFTLFAPTDEAFNAFFEANNLTISDLLNDREALAALLRHHIVPFPYLATDVIALDGALLSTLDGGTVAVSLVDGSVQIAGIPVNPDQLDRVGRNGVVHGIDGILE